MTTYSSAVIRASYTFRPMRRDDVPALYRLLQAIAAAEPDSYAPSLEDVARDFDDPWMDPATDSRLAITAGGEVVARASLIANPQPESEVRALMDFDVHPAHRNNELQEALLDWLEARGAERVRALAAASPGRGPLILQLLAWDSQHDLIACYQRHDFQPVRYSYRMRRDLRQPIPDRPLPAGLVLQPYSPALDERIRQAHNETFGDLWGHEPTSPSEWQQFLVQNSTFRPDFSFAVLDGDEVAAFVMNRFDAALGERTGFPAGWIGSVGTRRPWRKRGLASSLLVHSMRAFQAAGLEYAGLGVDSQNPTGALRLYEQLGFAPYIRGITFHKIVEPS